LQAIKLQIIHKNVDNTLFLFKLTNFTYKMPNAGLSLVSN